MAHAPSIYEYRSTSEWEAAMQEWLAENEPRYIVRYFDDSVGKYGEWIDVEVPTQDAAEALCAEKVTDFDKPLYFIVPGTRMSESVIVRPFGMGGDGKGESRYRAGDRPGGTRSEYRALGLR